MTTCATECARASAPPSGARRWQNLNRKRGEVLEQQLEALRDRGWMVAVHNDYRLSGKLMTFWLFTHPSGRWIKGEGETDAEALLQCLYQLDPATV